MSKKKLSLRPDALAWLAQKCSPTQWQRCLDLFDRRQLAALLTYLQSITDPEVFAEFEEKNLEPEVLAERRKEKPKNGKPRKTKSEPSGKAVSSPSHTVKS